MSDDFMMPNDGESFQPEPYVLQETPERVRAREVARSMAKANKAIIQEVITRLELRSDYYNTVASINVDIMTDPAKFMQNWQANQMTIVNLGKEIDYWKNQLTSAK